MSRQDAFSHNSFDFPRASQVSQGRAEDLASLIRSGLRQDAWAPDYTSAIQWGNTPATQEVVEVNLERAPLVWEALGEALDDTLSKKQISPPRLPLAAMDLKQAGLADELVFLDGVVRMHSRLLLERTDRYAYSGLGSAVVGALRLRPGTSLSMEDALLPPRVRRCLLLPRADQLNTTHTEIPGLPFAFEHYYYQDVDALDTSTQMPGTVMGNERAPEQALQQAMRQAEKDYLEVLIDQYHAEQRAATFIVDGPLPRYSTPHTAPDFPVVGYVKTLHTRYLPQEQHQVLYTLKAGQRSPLFRIGQRQISWYLCLANPRPTDTPLAGVVRLEVATHQVQSSIARVQQLADGLARVLPALVMARHEDPRSPQNLLPIHTLERQLKMRMGHRALIQRQLDAYFYHHLSAQELS